MAKWLAQSVPAFSDKSQAAYLATWRSFLEALAERGVDPASANVADVRAFLTSQTRPATALRYARLLDRIYQFAIEWRWVLSNPMHDLSEATARPEPPRKSAALDSSAALDALQRLPAPKSTKELRDQAILALALGSGVRLGELRALRLTQLVDTEAGLEVRPRAGSVRGRDLLVDPRACAPIRAWLHARTAHDSHSPLVFPGRDGQMIPANTLYRRVRKILEPAYGDRGLEHFGVGVLRATFAKRVALTESAEITQQRLGHRRLASTRRLLENLGVGGAGSAAPSASSPAVPKPLRDQHE